MRRLIPVLAAALMLSGCQPASKVQRTLALNELQNHAGYAEQQGDDARALELWREYIERRPHEAMARFRLGQVLLRNGNAQEASQHFRVAHDLKPGRIDYLEALAESLHQSGQREAMFQLLQDTMTEGGLAAGRMRYARFAMRAGMVDEAEESIRIAAAVEGTNSDTAYRMLADLARQTGDTESEVEALRTLLWFDATDYNVNQRLRELGVIPGPSLATPPRDGN